jgi:glutamate dehydrogenase (NAD(P)+)
LLEGFKDAEKMTDANELLTLDVDVLVPAAVEDVITKRNAQQIRAKLIVEGANGPTSAKADDIIAANDIVVVPDILANAGGVTVSYFEWVQNRLGYKWTKERINRRSDRIMISSFENVYETAQKYKVTLRIAAYIVAIDRVSKAYSFRGGF